jgi:hypothetical protein
MELWLGTMLSKAGIVLCMEADLEAMVSVLWLDVFNILNVTL